MLLAVAVILAILWVILFFALHMTSFAIHIIIVLAIISLIAHLFTGRKAV
jgi:tryptophan-rich sensory protein